MWVGEKVVAFLYRLGDCFVDAFVVLAERIDAATGAMASEHARSGHTAECGCPEKARDIASNSPYIEQWVRTQLLADKHIRALNGCDQEGLIVLPGLPEDKRTVYAPSQLKAWCWLKCKSAWRLEELRYGAKPDHNRTLAFARLDMLCSTGLVKLFL